MQPIVDRVERKFRGELNVIRVDVQGPRGRELAERYDFEFTPTFIFFDEEGNEVWRSAGDLDVARVQESLP